MAGGRDEARGDALGRARPVRPPLVGCMAGGQEMALIQNSYGELYRSDDFAPPKMMKLKHSNIGQIRADEARDMADAKQRDLPLCEVCGLPFERNSNNQKYCCRACYWKAHAQLKKARLARKENKS